jgi:small subunit ribosomal protein S2
VYVAARRNSLTRARGAGSSGRRFRCPDRGSSLAADEPEKEDMSVPTFTMRQLLEAGAHFGHHTRRWNPKMAPYIYGVRNGVHIIDLEQTVPLLYRALEAVRDVVSAGGRVLFVGTKRQAQDKVAEAASRCGQYYVNHRWLGGMLTNWKTVSQSIKRLKEMDERLAQGETGLTKKETLTLQRERDKLDKALGGIRDMGGLPDIIVVIDTNKEAIAVLEASKLGIPVVAILDSNSSPDGVTFPIPANDDALRAIETYCDLFAGAVLAGIQAEITASGGDVGELAEPTETVPTDEAAGEEQPAA